MSAPRSSFFQNSIQRNATACLVAVVLSSQAFCAVPTRHYDFEEGTAGESTSSVQDVTTDLLYSSDLTGLYASGHYWLEVGGGTARSLPGGPLQDVIDEWGLADPTLDAVEGEGTFVDVSDGSAFDSPAVGSTLALSFDGETFFDDFAVGSRGVYVDRDAYDNNDDSSNDNTTESFNLITQGWIYPFSANSGTEQTVWQAGTEQGSINITSDGFWEFRDLGSVDEDLLPEARVAVEFDAWTHVGIRRGGNGAEVFVNGELVDGNINPDPANFFGGFASIITLGGGASEEDPLFFNGLVDDFKVVGTGDGSWDPMVDLDFWASQPPMDECDPNTQGDLDGSGNVDFADFLILSAGFGSPATSHEQGDIDCNGSVEFADFLVLSQNFGSTVGAAAVPEPSGITLIVPLIGIAACIRKRR